MTNATVTKQPTAIQCPMSAIVADVDASRWHRGTAEGNSWHQMDILRCADGNRMDIGWCLNQRGPKFCHDIGWYLASAKPMSGGLLARNWLILVRECHNGAHIIWSSRDHQPDAGADPGDRHTMSRSICPTLVYIVLIFYTGFQKQVSHILQQIHHNSFRDH